MKVFFQKTTFTQDFYHLIVSYRWERPTEHQNSLQFNQIMVLRAQFFCQDRGSLHYKHEGFSILEFDRDKHMKKLCPNCVLKVKKSKRHGPQINPE